MLTLEAFRKVNDVNADKAYAEVDEVKETNECIEC